MKNHWIDQKEDEKPDFKNIVTIGEDGELLLNGKPLTPEEIKKIAEINAVW